MIRKPALIAAIASVSLGVGIPARAFAHDHGDQNGWHRGDDGDDEDGENDHRDYRQSHYYGRDRYNDRYADEAPYYQGRPDYRDYCRRSDGTTGLIVGGVGGALLGRELGKHRHRTTGTIIGAGVGALAGRAIERGGGC